MRPVCFAAILLAAITTAEAHADTIPLTVSGTETFESLDVSTQTYVERSPPLILTGTGTYDPGNGFPFLTISSNADILGLPQTIGLPLDPDGTFYSPYGPGSPEISVTFDYNPDGLSSGTFFYETHDNTGFFDPSSGEFIPGINFYDVYGTLTQTVTPEPSSFALLGTGLLVVTSRLRKRLRG